MAVGVARVLFHFSQGPSSGDGGSGELGGWFAWQSDSTVGGQSIRAVTHARIGGSRAVAVVPTRTSPAIFSLCSRRRRGCSLRRDPLTVEASTTISAELSCSVVLDS